MHGRAFSCSSKEGFIHISEFEIIYFIRKQKECRDALIKAADKKEHDEKQQAGEKVVLGVVIAGGVLGALLLALVVIGYKQ